MPRYDTGWRNFGGGRPGRMPGGQGFGGGYGGDFRGPRGPGGRGIDRVRLDEGFQPAGGDSGFGGGLMDGPGDRVHGPARYGLGPYHDRLRRRVRPDDELREEIEEALFYDTWVDADAVTVEVSGGIVTLRGELPDYAEVRYATDDAWDVDGVRGVRSELTVRSAQRDNQRQYGLDVEPPADAASGRGRTGARQQG